VNPKALAAFEALALKRLQNHNTTLKPTNIPTFETEYELSDYMTVI
jgi:hypothetical protein